MPEYRVTWTIDVDARNPREAARKAREMQVAPDTTATVFEVIRRDQIRPPHLVDLRDDGPTKLGG